MKEAIKEEKRKLEAERSESMARLKQIEKRLNKTEQTSKLWEDDSEENTDDELILRAKKQRLAARSNLPRKQKKSANEMDRLSVRNTANDDESCCKTGCNVQ